MPPTLLMNRGISGSTYNFSYLNFRKKCFIVIDCPSGIKNYVELKILVTNGFYKSAPPCCLYGTENYIY